MARFHVHSLRHAEALVLDLQTDLLDELATRIVAPLLPPGELPRIMRQLNPQFMLRGLPYVMATQFTSTISVTELGETVANLTSESHRIIAVTDFLFQGF